MTIGLPDPDLFDRTSLAIAPFAQSVLYAVAAKSDMTALGVFRSDDGGDTAIRRSSQAPTASGQRTMMARYGVRPHLIFKGQISAIEVAAADPDRVYVGTTAGAIHRSLDSDPLID